jgi:Protein of unknown function (DUF2975)
MNVLGRSSVSSLFKVLLDAAFGAVCGVTVLSVVVAVVASRKSTIDVSLSLPVRFEIDRSAYQIKGASGAPVDARIDDAGGNVTVGRPPAASVALATVGVIAMEAVVLVVLYRLRRIFRRLVENRPFLDENARGLRFIGLAVMAGELAWAALQYLGQRAVAGALDIIRRICTTATNAGRSIPQPSCSG